MEIKNPYEEGNCLSLSKYYPINKNAFDEGVEAATKIFAPKAFADELPKESQRVILLSKGGFAITSLFKKDRYSCNRKIYFHLFDEFTHWMPFPELNS
ncbi:MAG: hypothetical protein EBU90_01780 [Proteobacteria bacterium]|nr:hypothetical protein [Pseudomonadota bacterium]